MMDGCFSQNFHIRTLITLSEIFKFDPMFIYRTKKSSLAAHRQDRNVIMENPCSEIE